MSNEALLGLWSLAILVVVLAFCALPYFGKHPVETSRAPLRVRTEDHEAKLNALSDWLSQPKIVRAILRSNWATGDGLKALTTTSGQLTLEELNVALENILADRAVRQVICEYVMRKHGLPQYRVMEGLLDYAGKRKEIA